MGGDLLPFVNMVIVQFGYAGMNIISKLAMDSGMDPFVHVAYRQIFATISIAPFAYFMERVTVNQITYFLGLKYSTPTIACALNNINPAVTFLLAVPLGLEKLGVRSKAGQAKIWGTIICVGGALLLSFYHGKVVKIGDSGIHWIYAERTRTNNSIDHVSSSGPLLLVASAVSWATRLSKLYMAPYSSSALMCFMSSFQCVIIGFCFNHHMSAWSLNHSIRIVSTVYAGIVCSALAFCLMTCCIERKGPLYVSVFSPLLLVIVAILSWALLQEKLYTGTVAGSALIVLGLYGVLWGKNKEMSSLLHTQHHFEQGDEKSTHSKTPDFDLESNVTTTTPTIHSTAT
ncbi:hypothetical protein F511_07817 [Dorcoceras hygrometricum]|uniref:WAT1-related protein n=1 Tax=Dorcoceras hygrometricum TaxID=472368 RepID=A0A2Z7CKW7_9LAMI|nr:hypothetical protein F511_07817 [Dorcoceras hygrometricum]